MTETIEKPDSGTGRGSPQASWMRCQSAWRCTASPSSRRCAVEDRTDRGYPSLVDVLQ